MKRIRSYVMLILTIFYSAVYKIEIFRSLDESFRQNFNKK